MNRKLRRRCFLKWNSNTAKLQAVAPTMLCQMKIERNETTENFTNDVLSNENLDTAKLQEATPTMFCRLKIEHRDTTGSCTNNVLSNGIRTQRNYRKLHWLCFVRSHSNTAKYRKLHQRCFVKWNSNTEKSPINEHSQVSSVQFFDRLSRRVDVTDDSAEILFQPFLQKAIVSSFGMSRDVHTLTLLMLSIQHFLLTHITSDITRIAYNYPNRLQ